MSGREEVLEQAARARSWHFGKVLLFLGGMLIGILAVQSVVHLTGNEGTSHDLREKNGAELAAQGTHEADGGTGSSIGPSVGGGVRASNTAAAASQSGSAGPSPRSSQRTGGGMRRAYVTEASNPRTWCMALAMFQSIRDTNPDPTIDFVIIFAMWSEKNVRDDITAVHKFVSPFLINTAARLGVKIHFANPIPWPETVNIPGGPSVGWGMAFNKLLVWTLTQYDKVVWMDADTLVLHNYDHLFEEDEFTAAFTHACGNCNSPKTISGGLWVIEPDMKMLDRITELVAHKSKDNWRTGDMAVVSALFQDPIALEERKGSAIWPSRNDRGRGPDGKELPLPANNHWKMLNSSYDVLVGSCGAFDRCMKNRFNATGHWAQGYDRPDAWSLHYSCNPMGFNKPYCTRKVTEDENPFNHMGQPLPEGKTLATPECLLDAHDRFYATLSRALGRNAQAAYEKHRKDAGRPLPRDYGGIKSPSRRRMLAAKDHSSMHYFELNDLPHGVEWVVTQETEVA